MSKINKLQVTVLDRLPTPVKLHTLHADAASQFNDARFQQLCLDKGIVVTMGAPWHNIRIVVLNAHGKHYATLLTPY